MSNTSRIAILLALAALSATACSGPATDTAPDLMLADPRCAPVPMCGKSCGGDAECVSGRDVGQCISVPEGRFCFASCVLGKPTCPAGYECRQSNDSFRCLKPCQGDPDCIGNGAKCCAGACVDVMTDRKNCGTCAMACAEVANASIACIAGTCEIGRCTTGWGDCDVDQTNGCEIDTARDIRNCGGCGLECATPAGGRAACADSHCGITCDAGRKDCNQDTRDGCEVNLNTDDVNCGNCNIVCSNGKHCTAGVCS